MHPPYMLPFTSAASQRRCRAVLDQSPPVSGLTAVEPDRHHPDRGLPVHEARSPVDDRRAATRQHYHMVSNAGHQGKSWNVGYSTGKGALLNWLWHPGASS
jgi:hypothetical protein